MIKLVIIADDLTGALDTGVQFSKKNIPTLVTTKLDFNLEKIPKNIEVIVIDSESRHIKNNQAKIRIKEILSKFSKEKIQFFYKKIDSTFRGNIDFELSGFIEALGTKKLFFVPALPQNKRIVKNGTSYVDGNLLADTQFANDILNPITDSYIPNILTKNKELNLDIFCCSIANTPELKKDGIYLFDSENQEELNKIGKFLFENNSLAFTAGSAGFADILANYIHVDHPKTQIKIENKKTLFICGSVNNLSIQQCNYAELIGYNSYTLDFNNIIQKNFYNIKTTEEKIITELFQKNNNCLIRTSNQENIIEIALKFSKLNNIPIELLTKTIAENIGFLTKKLILNNDIKNLIVFGGDTLNGILNALHCDTIVPIKEISPGIVFTEITCQIGKINVISKAGGFGNKNVIEEIENFIKKYSQNIYKGEEIYEN